MQALEEITQAICDSDFDGLMAGAILRRVKPEINVIFSHAALIRSGAHDDIIARNTAYATSRFIRIAGYILTITSPINQIRTSLKFSNRMAGFSNGILHPLLRGLLLIFAKTM